MLNPDRTGGIVNAEEFGLLVWESAMQKRTRDQALSAQTHAAHSARREARAAFEAARLSRAAQEDASDELRTDLSVSEKMARARQRELNRAAAAQLSARLANDEKEEDAEHSVDDEDRAKQRLSSWEVLGLFRTLDTFPIPPPAPAPASSNARAAPPPPPPQTPIEKNAYRMRLMDVLSGVSALINDTAPAAPPQPFDLHAPQPPKGAARDFEFERYSSDWWHQVLPDANDSDEVARAKQQCIERFLKSRRRSVWARAFERKRPHARLQFAFRLHDSDADGYVCS